MHSLFTLPFNKSPPSILVKDVEVINFWVPINDPFPPQMCKDRPLWHGCEHLPRKVSLQCPVIALPRNSAKHARPCAHWCGWLAPAQKSIYCKALAHTNINERKFFELVQQHLLLQPASQTICIKWWVDGNHQHTCYTFGTPQGTLTSLSRHLIQQHCLGRTMSSASDSSGVPAAKTVSKS